MSWSIDFGWFCVAEWFDHMWAIELMVIWSMHIYARSCRVVSLDLSFGRSNGCFQKIGGVPPKSSIFIGFSIIFTIHFGGFTTPTPIFANNQMVLHFETFPKPSPFETKNPEAKIHVKHLHNRPAKAMAQRWWACEKTPRGKFDVFFFRFCVLGHGYTWWLFCFV